MELMTTKKINDSLYQISEHISDHIDVEMYLVVGEEKAAIIDTGYGLSGELLNEIRKTTDKPIVCLITHCDPDHAGGAAVFDDIHMSDKDQVLMDNGSLAPIGRIGTAQAQPGNEERSAYFKKHMIKAKSFTYKNIADGEVFDLGGKSLVAISFPGHTEGSMCFWNKEEDYCLVGDAVANIASPVLFFKKCLPVAVYKENLKSFMDKVGYTCHLYTGHNAEELEHDLIPEIFVLCDEVLAGKTEDDEPYTPPFLVKPADDAPIRDKMKAKAIAKLVGDKELGDAIPKEHRHPGFQASLKYNANKIR